jgi:acyl-coenzyme A synthetase/AMP-(fatty) acid ligase
VLVPFADLVALTVGLDAPLLAGARVTTMAELDAPRAGRAIANGVTVIVGSAAHFAALAELAEPGSLKLAISVGEPPSSELATKWEKRTGIEINAATTY